LKVAGIGCVEMRRRVETVLETHSLGGHVAHPVEVGSLDARVGLVEPTSGCLICVAVEVGGIGEAVGGEESHELGLPGPRLSTSNVVGVAEPEVVQ
jgi:hypothetical protein